MATYKYKLKKNGVQLISATENITTDPEGIILESVLEGMAEFYSAELSQKINRGLRESAYKHNSISQFVVHIIPLKRLQNDSNVSPGIISPMCSSRMRSSTSLEREYNAS